MVKSRQRAWRCRGRERLEVCRGDRKDMGVTRGRGGEWRFMEVGQIV